MEFDFIFILKEKLTSILWVPLSLSSPFHFVYILTYSFLALIIFLKKNPKTSFSLKNLVSYCFPRKIYLHSSFLLDLKIYFFILVVIPGHVYLKIFSIPALSLSGLQYLIKVVGVNESPFSYSPLMAPFIFLFFFLMADFSTYLTHRLEHQVPFLWKFHALHHNALVLNPLTVYRVHPISILFKTVSAMIFRTIGNIVLVYLFKGEVGFLTLINLEMGYYLFNFFGINLRHSHIPLSYGATLEKFLISPSQHQIHHSNNPVHANKNFGEVFAIWDYLFKTHSLSNKGTQIKFGLRGGGTPSYSLSFSLIHLFTVSSGWGIKLLTESIDRITAYQCHFETVLLKNTKNSQIS